MAVRQIFPLTNPYKQGGELGVCTVASLQWAKRCLQLGRGLGNANELSLSAHQLNGLMAVYRNLDADPVKQTEGLGLRIVGNDHAVTSIVDMQMIANATFPHVCIFWNSHHTMGYRVITRTVGQLGGRGPKQERECEYFDMENGLWLSSNQREMATKISTTFQAGNYAPIEGARVVQL